MFQAYLTEWRKGRMRGEARLGILHALVLEEKHEQVAQLALMLADGPEFRDERDEIVLIQATALSKSGHCDGALSLADEMDPRVAKDILKRCPRR